LVASAEAGHASSATNKKKSSSVAYKVLIALVYLIAVTVILVTLLLDRTSCRRRVSSADEPTPASQRGLAPAGAGPATARSLGRAARD
jgi:hypothetical protein